MTNADPQPNSRTTTAPASVVGRVTGAARLARDGATILMGRVPGTLNAARAGAHGTTSALQTLPNSTLHWLTAGSVGLGAGFYLVGASRLMVAVGVAPALIIGSAIALRPGAPVQPTEALW
jgi:hypothetical protein